MAEEQQSAAAPEAQTAEVSEFESLLGKGIGVKKWDDPKGKLIRDAVKTLAAQALESAQAIPGDVYKTINDMVAALDKTISRQVNQILHHPDFQKLESAWRGLHYMVNNTETDTSLKIRVMNISKKDATKSLKKFRGTSWDQSPLFKKVYGAEFDQLGGSPYGMLVGDYEFSHQADDVDLLTDFAKIASAAHAPFISAASSNLLDMDSWQELSNPRDLAKVVDAPTHAKWNGFRDSLDSAYVGLTAPRVLGRLPYGGKHGQSCDDYEAFVEEVDGKDHSKYLWMNSAYAMGTNIARAFKLYGWCSRIRGVESGGTVEGLPVHNFPTDDGGTDMKCPTEIAIGDRREQEMAGLGLMPLIHRKGTDQATYISAQSVNRPIKYQKEEDNANAQLTARLQYMFAMCRFAHYMKVMVRDKIGSFKERADMEKYLNDWITNYVTTDSGASETVKAEYPLAEARVEVADVKGNPGFYTAKFFLRPHFQLEGLKANLHLVSKLPSGKG